MVSLWFFGAGLGAVIALVWFVVGLFSIIKDNGRMVGGAVIFLLFVLLVGGGTCALNVQMLHIGNLSGL